MTSIDLTTLESRIASASEAEVHLLCAELGKELGVARDAVEGRSITAAACIAAVEADLTTARDEIERLTDIKDALKRQVKGACARIAELETAVQTQNGVIVSACQKNNNLKTELRWYG